MMRGMTKTPLSDAELQAFLQEHPGWKVEGGMLARTFEARSFLGAIDFVHRVAKVAEALDHHPDIDIRWRKVTLRLVTHDAGNRITTLDAQVARDCADLFASMG
jgi:4a-hydroxytetrahydrobiopterin dehydratase